MVFCAATNCSNSFKSSISMFDFPKDDKTFTRLYGVRTISQKTALNKISRQEVRWFRLSSLGDDLKKDAVLTIFNYKIGIGQKRSHGKNHRVRQRAEQHTRETPNLSVQRFHNEEN